MYETINEQLRMKFYHNPQIRSELKAAEASVLAGQQTSFIAAQQLLDTYYNNLLVP
jgi:LAO/AO transport system kinase